MKDQYVGDVNDYFKYSLLRELGEAIAGRLRVCWMLTPPDGRTDGGLTGYLAQSDRFRAIDPPLFDALARIVDDGTRSVAAVERADVLPGAWFDSTVVPQGPAERAAWLDSFLRKATSQDVLFFDPDNGLEITSVPRGRRHSDKYVYWDEVAAALQTPASVVIYQHFPRKPREFFLRSLLVSLGTLAPGRHLLAIYTSRVAYLIAASARHEHALHEASSRVAARWHARLYVADCVV